MATVEAPPIPRLKERYRAEIRPQLATELALNVMAVPALEKIIVNMGVGDVLRDGKALEHAVADLTVITGQKPIVTKAKKSIAGFKLRAGVSIGCKVTLRGDRMWEFLDRLLTTALPRIRAADLPRDRVRQGGQDPGDGRDARHDGSQRRPGPGTAQGTRLSVPNLMWA